MVRLARAVGVGRTFQSLCALKSAAEDGRTSSACAMSRDAVAATALGVCPSSAALSVEDSYRPENFLETPARRHPTIHQSLFTIHQPFTPSGSPASAAPARSTPPLR